MTAVRSTPELFRRSYRRALVTLPLRIDCTEVPEASSLTVLGGAVIEGRTIAFGTLASRPRLWICTTGTARAATAAPGAAEEPRVIGYLTGLVAGEPELWICDTDSWEWVNSGTVSAGLKAAAARVWSDCVRTCNG